MTEIQKREALQILIEIVKVTIAFGICGVAVVIGLCL